MGWIDRSMRRTARAAKKKKKSVVASISRSIDQQKVWGSGREPTAAAFWIARTSSATPPPTPGPFSGFYERSDTSCQLHSFILSLYIRIMFSINRSINSIQSINHPSLFSPFFPPSPSPSRINRAHRSPSMKQLPTGPAEPRSGSTEASARRRPLMPPTTRREGSTTCLGLFGFWGLLSV